MKAIIDGKELSFHKPENHWLPETADDIQIMEISGEQIFLIVNGKTFTARCLSVNRPEKTVEILLNRRKYNVQIKEPLDDLLHSMGLDVLPATSAVAIKAPMPGLVLDVLVTEGTAVAKGDKVIVLEAMKMENVIKAGGDGNVARILVQKGQTVDKNQVLVEFS